MTDISDPAPATTPAKAKPVLVLQGGGALGSYQAGAYQALCHHDFEPEWIAGISIGAVNAAIIAGNPPEKRVDRLKQFWEMVSAPVPWSPITADDRGRSFFNETSAAMVATFGVPGFFTPRVPPAPLWPPGSPQSQSYYDTAPLKRTQVVSWQPASQGIAATLGALVGVILSKTMGGEALEAYGWRIAFLLGAACLPFGLWMRQALPETVSRSAAEASSHLVQARGHLKIIVLALIIIAYGTIATYISHYITTYAQDTLHVAPPLAFATSVVSLGLSIGGTLFGGWLADRIGRKPVLVWPQLAFLLLTYPVFLWIVHAPGPASLLGGFGFMTLVGSLAASAIYATLIESLPKAIRGGVFATIYAVSIAIFGGTAQLIVTWLIHVSGDPLAPAWYLLAAGVIGFIALLMLPETAPVKVGVK